MRHSHFGFKPHDISFGARLISSFWPEFSRRLGEQVVDPVSTTVQGSVFSDVIVGFGNTERVVSGPGNDLVLLSEDSTDVAVYSPSGSDTLVIPTRVDKAVTVDWVALTASIVLPDFDPDATVIETGPGQLEIRDQSGNVVLLGVASPTGDPMPIETIANGILLGADQTPLLPGSTATPNPLLTIAEDIEGGAVRGTRLSEVIIVDETVGSVKARGGNDTIIADFRDAQSNGPVLIEGGRGSNTIIVRYDEETADIEDCFIFDIGGDGIALPPTQKDTVRLPDFGIATEVLDLGGGNVQLYDPTTGLLQTLRLEDREGNPLEGDDWDYSFTEFGSAGTDLSHPYNQEALSGPDENYLLIEVLH